MFHWSGTSVAKPSSEHHPGGHSLHRLYTLLLVALLVPNSPSVASEEQVIVSPDSLNFGLWQTGGRITDTIRVRNISAEAFTVTSLTLEGEGFVLSPTPLTGDLLILEGYDEVSIPIAFLPESRMPYEARFDITIDARNYSISVLGEGVAESVVINEILADPPAGDDGDANRDGTRHSSEDEFVEILNISGYLVSLEGFTLSDRRTRRSARFAFPPSTAIGPGERIVLFGGGDPTGFSGQVFVDDGKIGGGLTNSGDAVYLISPAEDTVAVAEYGKEAGADQSIVRHPDGRGAFVRHRTPPGIDRFSPGKIRSPLASILTQSDTIQVTLGQSIVPEVFGISGDSDTLDIGDDVTWSTDAPSVVEWLADAWQVLLPGTARLTAHFDTIFSLPIPLVARVSTPFSLSTVPSDTVVLLGSEFKFLAFAESGKLEADITSLAEWLLPDGILAVTGRAGELRAIGTGDGDVVTTFAGQSSTSVVSVSLPGDFDLDGQWTSADALRLIHIALEIPPEPQAYELLGADSNQDGTVDVIDLVDLVDRILGRPRSKSVLVAAVTWDQMGTTLSIQGPPVRAIIVEMRGTGSLSSSELEVVGAGRLWTLSPLTNDRIYCPVEVLAIGTVSRVFVVADFGRQVASRTDVSRYPLVAYPNPFNAHTALEFSISEASHVRLDVYNILGQKIIELARGVRPAGRHRIIWDGRDRSHSPVGSGIYVGRLRTETRTELVRMVLLQ